MLTKSENDMAGHTLCLYLCLGEGLWDGFALGEQNVRGQGGLWL